MLQKVKILISLSQYYTDFSCSGLTISIRTVDSSAVPMCVSSITASLAVHALMTTTYTNGIQSTYYDYVLNDESTSSSITTMTSGIAVADPLYVAWESADLSLFPVGYATSLAQEIGVAFTPTATPASTGTRSGPSQTGSSGNSSSSDSGLSSGARLGIGVGVGVGASLLIALIAMAFIIRRLRRRNRAVTAYPPAGSPTAGSDTGLIKDKWYHRSRPSEGIELSNAPGELDSRPVHLGELDSVPVFPSFNTPVELDGSQVSHPHQ